MTNFLRGWLRLWLLFVFASGPAAALAQADPLPSWNDGAVKQGIVGFLRAATMADGSYFPPPLLGV
ncbi:hypothetical protein GCM10028796_25630 [Ramlibacter monticola]|uniref:Uncharacterized protein n=1 Tax=Ramlibacter monticola TaxID=1926872 RepID=A0A937CVD8_9BURK|nr:hypothetical protein [Ramlibacter monticola]MBL0393619.1 hypothetical protein [Ramlibacter monticola]